MHYVNYRRTVSEVRWNLLKM